MNWLAVPWITGIYCISAECMIAYILMGVFLFSMNHFEKVNIGLPSDKNKLFVRKCTVSFIYLWASSGVFRRVGITGISLQPSVFGLHAALIDFSPSLLKCAINQYCNKSSFIFEKCSFQLSGHEVLPLSMQLEAETSLHLASSLICPTTDTWLYIHHQVMAHSEPWNDHIHYKHKHNHEQHLKHMVTSISCVHVEAFLQHTAPILN